MIKNVLKYDFKPQDRSSAKIKQNYKIIKNPSLALLLKGTSNFKSVQIFAKNMHTTLMVRGSLKVHMERRGGRVGVSLKLNFMTELTGKE